jgi:hypothetical protein
MNKGANLKGRPQTGLGSRMIGCRCLEKEKVLVKRTK